MHSIQSDKAHVTLGKFSSLNSELKLEDFPKVHEERSCTSCSHAARSDQVSFGLANVYTVSKETSLHLSHCAIGQSRALSPVSLFHRTVTCPQSCLTVP